jgi:preprotein translocase subunit Sec63
LLSELKSHIYLTKQELQKIFKLRNVVSSCMWQCICTLLQKIQSYSQ